MNDKEKIKLRRMLIFVLGASIFLLIIILLTIPLNSISKKVNYLTGYYQGSDYDTKQMCDLGNLNYENGYCYDKEVPRGKPYLSYMDCSWIKLAVYTEYPRPSLYDKFIMELYNCEVVRKW